MVRSMRVVFIVAISVFSLLACKEDIYDLKISKESLVMPARTSAKLDAQYNSFTHTVFVGHTWTSSDSSVATVYTDGTVVGIAPGSATISAKSWQTTSAACSVTVTAASPSTWTRKTWIAPTGWLSVALSADGSKLAAVENRRLEDNTENQPGRIFTSSDGGISWVHRTSAGIRNWISIVSSADGNRLAAISDRLYLSADSGETWTETGIWADEIAMSADGNHIVAASDENYLKISADFGATWTSQAGPGRRNWQSVALNADGNRVYSSSYEIAFPSRLQLIRSADYGVTWEGLALAGFTIESLATSDNGKYLFGTSGSHPEGHLWVSSNFGAVIAEQVVSLQMPKWGGVACSSDGSKAYTFERYGYIHKSVDFGATWQELTSVGKGNWTSIDTNASGDIVIAAMYEGDIFIGN